MMDKVPNDKILIDNLKGLNEAEKIYIEKLLASSPLAFALCDNQLNIIAANQLLYDQLSLSFEEICEMNLKDLTNDSFPYFKKALSRLSSQSKTEIKSIELKDKKNKVLGGSAILSKLNKEETGLYTVFFTNLENKKENQLITETGKLDSFLYSQTRRGKWLLDLNSRQFFGNEICFSLLGIQSKTGVASFRDILEIFASKEDRDNIEKDLLRLEKNSLPIEKEIRLKSDMPNSNGIKYIRLIMNKFNF
ncbi:MAG: hypothetical protein ACP5E3_08980, partial [Bacteroidales bacterium]